MPGLVDRWTVLPVLTLTGCLAVAPLAHAEVDNETVQLRGYALQAWADARLHPRLMQPVPVRLAMLRNDSVTSSEAENRNADRDDAERDGVPVAVLDEMLAAQLEGSGRFMLVADDEPRHAASLEVRVLRYQPPYRRGDRSGFWQQTRSQWRSWFAEDPQALAVTVEATWHDPAQASLRRLTVRVDGDSCLRLPHAPVTAGSNPSDTFMAEYRHSSIGQASLAAMNRIVAWLDAMHGYEQQSLAVVAVRGNRLQLADPQRWLQGHQELTLYHRDRSEHAIGTIRVAPGDGALREAWPLTLAAGSVRPGDWVHLSRPTPEPSIRPAPQPPGSTCQRAEAEAPQTAAAGLDDNRHTDAPMLPDSADDRPGS